MSDTKIKYNLEPTYTVGDDAFAEYEGKYWRSNYKSEGFKEISQEEFEYYLEHLEDFEY